MAKKDFDLDGDGVLTPEEIEAAKLLKEAESAEEKADTQKRMAWIAMISMLGFTGFIPPFYVRRTSGSTRRSTWSILYSTSWCSWSIYGNVCLHE